MKIGFVTLEYAPKKGGIASALATVVGALPADEAAVLTHEPIKGLRGTVNDSVGHRLIRQKLLRRFLWPLWLPTLGIVCRFIKAERVDFIHISQILPLGYAAVWGQWWTKTPFIVSLHGLDINFIRTHPWKRFWAVRILHRARIIVTNTEFTKSLVDSIEPGLMQKTVVMYPTPLITPERFPVDPQATARLKSRYALMSRKIILSVGRLVARKGYDTTLAAMVEVLALHPDAIYIIVGEGPDFERLAATVSALKIGHAMRFVGAVSDEELALWYAAADVFVLASRQMGEDVEGFGIVFLEAAAFGKPVIGGRSGGVAEAIVHGVTGLMVNPDSPEDLARALHEILRNPSYGKVLGSAGRERSQANFQAKTQARKLLHALERYA